MSAVVPTGRDVFLSNSVPAHPIRQEYRTRLFLFKDTNKYVAHTMCPGLDKERFMLVTVCRNAIKICIFSFPAELLNYYTGYITHLLQ